MIDGGNMRIENTQHLRSLILVLLMLTSFALPMLSPFEPEEELLDEENVRMQTNMGPEIVVNVENSLGFGSSNIDRNHGFVGGPNGTAYIIGEFQGTLTFGSYSLSSSGSYFDGYVAKLNNQGNWDWAVKLGGTSTDRTYGLAVDSSGNAFVTGNFYGTCHFYDKTGQSSGNLSSAGSSDLYVAKLKSDGSDWDWLAKIGSSGYSDGGNDIVVDNSGSAYVSGYIGDNSSVYSHDGEFVGYQYTNGGLDAFVGKIDSSGDWKWVQTGGSSANDAAVRLDIGSNGSVVTGGYYQAEADFGSTTLSHWQDKEAFVAEVNSNGWVFAKGGTGNGDNTVRSVKFDSSGDIYYLTQYSDNLSMGSGYSSGFNQNTLVGKISGTTNQYVWQNVSSSSNVLNGINMAISPDGNLTVVGEYSGTANFNGQQFSRTGTSGQDGYIQGLDTSNGNQKYVFTIGSGGNNNDIMINDLMFDSNPTGGGVSDVVAFSGYFKGTATFGPGNSLTSSGNEDGFIAKVKFAEEGCYINGLDYNNATEWVHCAGTSSGEVVVHDSAVDSSGNSYYTGFFQETAVFGSKILSSSGAGDIFVAKFSSSGSWAWAVSAGGTGSDKGYGIDIDSNGYVYVTGAFDGTVSFGGISKTSSGSSDIFVAKLSSSSGGWIFATKAGGTGGDSGKGIDIDSTGNIYVTGHTVGTSTFGSTQISGNGSDDAFVAKLSSSGSWTWAVKADCSSSDKGNAIAVDSSGNAYIAGHFYGTINFGSTSLTSGGSYDGFISKLSSSGSWQWAVKVSGIAGYEADGIAVDSSGNAYVTGFFSLTANFGSTSLSSNGGIDVFVTKLSSSGSWTWAAKAGGSSGDRGHGIDVDSSGNAYVAGKFKGTASFGSTSITSSGNDDAFLAQISSTGSWVWANGAGGTGDDKAKSVSVGSNGIGYVGGAFRGVAEIGMQNFTCDSSICGMFVKTPVYVSTLAIDTTSFDPATVGTSYSYTLSASGGSSYTWATSSNLPSGLTLSTAGVLSGTPTGTGTYQLVIQVSDGTSTVSKTLTLVINAAANEETITADLNWNYSSGYLESLWEAEGLATDSTSYVVLYRLFDQADNSTFISGNSGWSSQSSSEPRTDSFGMADYGFSVGDIVCYNTTLHEGTAATATEANKLDVDEACTEVTDGTVSIFIESDDSGNGNSYPSIPAAWGDVDGDGDLDLAVGNNANKNEIYLNSGTTLATTSSWTSKDYKYTYALAWGDMDGDGDLDLAVGNENQNNEVYLNTGEGLATTPVWTSSNSLLTRSVAWGDVDGDGDLELAVGKNVLVV